MHTACVPPRVRPGGTCKKGVLNTLRFDSVTVRAVERKSGKSEGTLSEADPV